MSRLTQMHTRVEEWRWKIHSALASAAQAIKPLAPHCPGFLMGLLLTLCTSWLVAQWVAHAVVKQELVVASRKIFPQREKPPPVAQQGSGRAATDSVGVQPYLGIRGKEVRQGGIQGVKVLEVFPGAPAATAGLRAASDPSPSSPQGAVGKTGHIIIGANGQLIRTEAALAKVIAQSAPGSILTLLVVDGESYEIISVTLGAVAQTPATVLAVAERTPQSLTPAGTKTIRPR